MRSLETEPETRHTSQIQLEQKEKIMSQPQNTTTGENPAEAYQRYFVPGMFIAWSEVLLERAAPQSGEQVLDVACGTGVVARNVAPKVGSTGSVVALDINPAMLAVARSTPASSGASITWQEGSALALPFPDETFDLVLCQQGLQFFPDRVVALKEMRRVLRPQGRVVLSVLQALQYNPIYEALYDAAARRLGTTASALASPFSLNDPDELRGLFQSAGFQQVEVAPAMITARFPEPARFVQMTVLSSAAVLPVFAQMEPAARKELVEAVAQDLQPMLRSYIDGDAILFPIAGYIGLAHV